jgi:hypothetical protein
MSWVCTVLFPIKVLDAIACRVVLAELRLVFCLIELRILVPQQSFQDIDCSKGVGSAHDKDAEQTGELAIVDSVGCRVEVTASGLCGRSRHKWEGGVVGDKSKDWAL